MMDAQAEVQGSSRPSPHLIVGGLATLAFFMLASFAFDDITTDNATTFHAEYTCLILCAAWCLFVAVRLIRRGNLILGMVSLVMLIAAALGQREIGPGTAPGWRLEYVATLAGVLWFLVLSFVLIVKGFRAERQSGKPITIST